MDRAFEIAGRKIGPDQPPYVIAELSGNHNGEFERALRLIKAAKDAGADAVKLQTYTADTITIDCDKPDFLIREGLWRGRRLHELYREAHTRWEWHPALFDYARDVGIACFSTPFDPTAIEFLKSLHAPAYKIASFEIVDTPLIELAAETGKPLIVSTGMASEDEISDALAAVRRGGGEHVAVLHCVSAYPTAVEEANLGRIAHLSSRYGCVVGLSDHTLGIEVPIAAVALGASLIEKHLTLSRAAGGPDAAFSLEPEEFAALVRGARAAFEATRPRTVRGAVEQANIELRRSLYVVRNIAQGETLSAENVRSIRPGHGLPPKHLPEVLGRRARRYLARGTPLRWDDIDAPADRA